MNLSRTQKDVHFLKYPIYVGGNRGRGQISHYFGRTILHGGAKYRATGSWIQQAVQKVDLFGNLRIYAYFQLPEAFRRIVLLLE